MRSWKKLVGIENLTSDSGPELSTGGPEWWVRELSLKQRVRLGRLSFFKSAAYRGSLCKVFNREPLSLRSNHRHVGIKPGPALKRFVGLVPESIDFGD